MMSFISCIHTSITTSGADQMKGEEAGLIQRPAA